MRILILTAFLAISGAVIPDAIGQDQRSPFSSPAEKNFILRTAGRDGQIERMEWEANQTDRGHFKYLDWNKLLNFDLDGDGLVGVNEFYSYIERRLAATSGNSKDEEVKADSRRTRTPSDLDLSDRIRAVAFNSSGLNTPSGLDRRRLFRHSQIAQRIKFQRKADPQKLEEIDRRRREQLVSMSERRRVASMESARRASANPERIRDIYKARLVKHRLSRSDSGTSSLRNSLIDARRRGTAQEDPMARRRDQLQESRRRGTPALDVRERYNSVRRPLRPTQLGTTRDTRTREASDIRGLMPPSTGNKSRAATPPKKKTPERNGKTNNRGKNDSQGIRGSTRR